MRRAAAALIVISPLHVAIAQSTMGAQPEARVEVIAGRNPQLLGGVGVSIPAGVYTRLGFNAAGGIARTDTRTAGAARADVSLRFLLDPFRQSRVGLYGLAGLSGMYLAGEGWMPRVFIGLGLEGASRGRAITSVEVALGGGLRVAAVVRRARAGRR